MIGSRRRRLDDIEASEECVERRQKRLKKEEWMVSVDERQGVAGEQTARRQKRSLPLALTAAS